MNPQQTDSQESLDLPWPESSQQASHGNESAGVQGNSEVVQSMAMETGLSGPAASSPTQVQQAATPGSIPPSLPAQQISAAASSVQGTPAIADDIDLIEREWVHIAKEIVEQTKDDPYAQNKAINKVKVDYIKKRYDKELKLENN